jgi:hypothetical protein
LALAHRRQLEGALLETLAEKTETRAVKEDHLAQFPTPIEEQVQVPVGRLEP